MGGVVGGLVGGVFGGGGLLGGVMNSFVGDIVNDLVDQFGLNDIAQAFNNLVGDLLETGLSFIIDGLPIPGFMKDMAKDTLGNIIDGSKGDVPRAAQDAVNEKLGGTAEDVVDNFLNFVQEEMDEEVKGGEGNWLVALAKALGKASGNHLEKMIELGEKMGSLDGSGEDKGEFAETQAMFQAESQIFKMFQEAISTMLKSIGEGMSSVARKQ